MTDADRRGLPAGYSIRPPADGEGEAIARMTNEETEALIGVPVITVDWVVTPWRAPGADRDHDFAVVVAPDGGLAGYVSVQADPPYTAVFGIGVVDLGHHGRGIGAVLVAEAERRARRFLALAEPGQRVVMRMGALSGEPRVSSLLAGRGYTEVRRFIEMRIVFETPPEPASPVDGIEIRPPAAGDVAAVYACLTEAFADHWGDTWSTEEAWVHDHVEAGDADLGLWHLAWDGRELAGALIARAGAAGGTDGYVAELAVRRRYRRRGIAEALLRTSFAQFHARGATGVILHVDARSPTGATRVYERVGMTSTPRFSTWEKELRAGRPAG